MLAMSPDVARRSTPVTGSTTLGADEPVTTIGPSSGMVRSYCGSRPRNVKLGGAILRYFSTTAAGNRTSPVSSSTVQPCFLKTSRAGAKWARMPTVSRTSTEASCVRRTSASVSSSTNLMPSCLLCDLGELVQVVLDVLHEAAPGD